MHAHGRLWQLRASSMNSCIFNTLRSEGKSTINRGKSVGLIVDTVRHTVSWYPFILFCTLMSVRAAIGLDILLLIVPFYTVLYVSLKHELAQ